MGLSNAKPETYFIYVLKLESERWYVGSTKNISKRMRTHFSQGGAIATKQCAPVEIDAIYRLIDYQIRTDCAHERAEVIVAATVAEQYGMDKVRGGKHGKGWADVPSPGNLRDIDRYMRFAKTEEGRKLMSSLHPLSISEALDERTAKLLPIYRAQRSAQSKSCGDAHIKRQSPQDHVMRNISATLPSLDSSSKCNTPHGRPCIISGVL